MAFAPPVGSSARTSTPGFAIANPVDAASTLGSMSTSETRSAYRRVSPIAQRAGSKDSNGATPASGFEAPPGLIAADQPEVHQDRVVAAQERLPRPERVALARRVVVGVADHDLATVGGRRIGEPSGRLGARLHRVPAVLEPLVVVAGRDPVGPALQQRLVDPRLVRDRELHRHADRVRVVAARRLVALHDVDDPVLPLGRVAPRRRLVHAEELRRTPSSPSRRRSTRSTTSQSTFGRSWSVSTTFLM